MSSRDGFFGHSKVREKHLTAVITRADGRVEDLGTIAYWHRNPLKRWAWNIWIFLRNMKGKRNGH